MLDIKNLSFVEPIDKEAKRISGEGVGMFVVGAVGAWAIGKGLDYAVDEWH